jgi:hypothetical protein
MLLANKKYFGKKKKSTLLHLYSIFLTKRLVDFIFEKKKLR